MNTQKRDMFEMWKDNGDLDRILDFVRDCARKLVTQAEMCEHLGITETTFSKLKKKHPELQEAIDKSKLDLKKDLADAMYKLAMYKSNGCLVLVIYLDKLKNASAFFSFYDNLSVLYSPIFRF